MLLQRLRQMGIMFLHTILVFYSGYKQRKETIVRSYANDQKHVYVIRLINYERTPRKISRETHSTKHGTASYSVHKVIF